MHAACICPPPGCECILTPIPDPPSQRSGIVDNAKGALGQAKDGVEDTLESGKDKVMEAAEGVKDGAASIKEKVFGK
jgi:hypothetical protein